jgi:hypothetical protein
MPVQHVVVTMHADINAAVSVGGWETEAAGTQRRSWMTARVETIARFSSSLEVVSPYVGHVWVPMAAEVFVHRIRGGH